MAIIITLYITLVRGVCAVNVIRLKPGRSGRGPSSGSSLAGIGLPTSFLQGVADRLCSFDKELHIFLQKNAIDFFLFFVVVS